MELTLCYNSLALVLGESPGDRVKRDRTARLVKVEHLLYQNPQGLTPREIAEECNVSVRTAYRDLKALEDENIVFISDLGKGRRSLVEGHFLPPIGFTLPEAMTIFLAARLMLSYSGRYDPDIASTFIKLNSIVPPPLRDQIQKAMDWMHKLPGDEKYLRTLATLADAWVHQKRVKISYRALERREAIEHLIEPYFIEPVAEGRSSYVIARSHRRNTLLPFKIERIEAIEATSETYVIPPDFDANKYLGSSWGIIVDEKVKTVRLKVAPAIARIMEETRWHPSQVVKQQKDGSAIMTLRAAVTVELSSWILRWGEQMEVLEPKELREEVLRTAKALVKIYQKK